MLPRKQHFNFNLVFPQRTGVYHTIKNPENYIVAYSLNRSILIIYLFFFKKDYDTFQILTWFSWWILRKKWKGAQDEI